MSYISNAMGWVLAQLSDLCNNNFAASVVLFTVLVNLVMLPLTIKSQKSTAKQAKIKPKMDALKKKYGNDKQKYSQAMNELYAKEGVSMSGGCLPMVIRLLVMMGVYWAVISPLTYVVSLDTAAINEAKKWVTYEKVANDTSIDWNAAGLEAMLSDGTVVEFTDKFGGDKQHYAKMIIAQNVDSAEADSISKDSAEQKIKTLIKSNKVNREVEIVQYLSGEKANPVIVEKFKAKNGDLNSLNKIDFDLFGLNLTETPNFSWNFANWQPIWLIPIISFATSMLSSIVSMKLQKKNNPDAPNMGTMMLIMPVFSLVIAFGVPGAVGFYWACSNVISGGLQTVMQMLYSPNMVVAREQSKAVVLRANNEKLKIERVKNRTENSDK